MLVQPWAQPWAQLYKLLPKSQLRYNIARKSTPEHNEKQSDYERETTSAQVAAEAAMWLGTVIWEHGRFWGLLTHDRRVILPCAARLAHDRTRTDHPMANRSV